MTQPTLYGIHDLGGAHLLGDSPGWVVHTVDVYSGAPVRKQGRVTPIVRLNHSHHGKGTIPPNADYWPEFARLSAQYVQTCQGVEWFTIGNEPNIKVEWGKDEPPLMPEQYAACYALVYDAIKAVAPDVRIAPAAVGPYNAETGIGWIEYFRRMNAGIGYHRIDWINLHTYSRGYEARSVTDNSRMGGAFTAYFKGFRAYLDFLAAVPDELRHLPVHITEANGNGEWPDSNTGWVQSAYAEIERHNRLSGTQKIQSMSLFRWNNESDNAPTNWGIQDKSGVREDFRQAVAKGYRAPLAAHETPNVNSKPTSDALTHSYLPHVGTPPQEPPKPQEPSLPPRQIGEDFKRRVPDLAPYTPVPGRKLYRLVKAEYVPDGAHRFGPDHHILVDVVDAQGKRLMGTPVNFYWGGGIHITTVNKPTGPYGADYGMTSAGHSFGVWIGNFREASDDVFGMGLGKIGSEHMGDHVTYYLVYQEVTVPQRTEQPAQPTAAPVTPQPQPTQSGIINPVTALAFLHVESGNHPFMGGLLTIRFEVHRFQDFLGNDELFHRHFKFTPRKYNDQHWRTSPDAPWQHAHGSMAQRHELLRFARSLNDTAALNSTGMGMAQIMGHNAQRVGYASPQAMFNAFRHEKYGVNAQLMGFVNYVLSDGDLADALRRRDWIPAIQRYNGTGQEEYYLGQLSNALTEIEWALRSA